MDDKTKTLMIDHMRAIDLLDELVDYGKRKKAEIVYRKCLRAGKRILAERIKRKYNLREQHDDKITAFGFAIACANSRLNSKKFR